MTEPTHYLLTMAVVAAVSIAPLLLWWAEEVAARRRRRQVDRLSPEAREALRRWSS
jgi:hypothetical protein